MSDTGKHHESRHHYEHDFHGSINHLAERYLAQDGLSFNFGRAGEKYQFAIGNEGNDSLVGGKAKDYMWGLGGNDKIAGRGGNDILYGDSGDDLITSRGGADRLEGGNGNDRLFGGDNADMLAGGSGDDYLDEGKGHGALEGGAGNDVLVGGQGPDAFMVDRMSGDDIIKDFTPGPGMFDHLALRDLRWEDLSFEDTQDGVKVSWEGGSVLLENVTQSQLAQDDFMFANSPDLPPSARQADGPTSERPSPSSEGQHFQGDPLPGSNFDRAADKAIHNDDGLDLTFTGDEAYRIKVGTSDKDTFAGDARWDHFFGRKGDDLAFGEDGNDILQGDDGNDDLYGGMGMDRLNGGEGNDRLFGGAEADELMGMNGEDYLDAGAGHDMIEGGEGNDTIAGGTGADAFIVEPGSGFDIVLDFEARGDAQGAFDHLALRDILPEQVSVVDTSEGALVSWNTDDDAAREGSVLLEGVFREDLRQSDFMFVNEPGFVVGINDFGSDYIF
jgi:Ca2+-binding RTX toxin-like protein